MVPQDHDGVVHGVCARSQQVGEDGDSKLHGGQKTLQRFGGLVSSLDKLCMAHVDIILVKENVGCPLLGETQETVAQLTQLEAYRKYVRTRRS